MRKTIINKSENSKAADTKLNLSQSIVSVTESLMKRDSNFLLDTDFGRYFIRRGHLTTSTHTHSIENWDRVYPDKHNMSLLRDTSIVSMITIDRSTKLNVQLLIVTRALCEAYLRYVCYTDYIKEDTYDTMAALWIKHVSGKIGWYTSASDLANDFIAGCGPNFNSKNNQSFLLDNFCREYFYNKYSAINMAAMGMQSVLEDLDRYLLEKTKIGWPIVSPFYRMVLGLCVRNERLNKVMKGIERVRKNPNLNNNTFIIREIFNPEPPKEEKGDKKEEKKPSIFDCLKDEIKDK